MDFGKAIEAIKDFKKVAREGWNGKEMYIYLVFRDLPYPPVSIGESWKAGAFQSLPFLVMKTADNKLVPWLASQTDILSCDWQVVE